MAMPQLKRLDLTSRPICESIIHHAQSGFAVGLKVADTLK